MTRNTRDQVFVKPSNDMYTALSGVACLLALLGIVALIMQHTAVFGDSLFMPTGK